MMTDQPPALSRRTVLAGLGAAAITPALQIGDAAAAPARKSLTISAAPGTIVLKPGAAPVGRPALSLDGPALRRGDEVAVEFANQLDQPALLTLRGLDGAVAAEPLVKTKPVPPGGSDRFLLPLRSAGTLLADLRLTADAGTAPMPALPLVVAESEPPQVDGDQVVLIEDFRLGEDGKLRPSGVDVGAMPWLYTVNGQPSAELAVRTHGRFRFRFINACQRNVIALRIEDHNVWVMALDSQPAEPFLARGGALVIAAGGRVDVLIDALKPPGSSAAITLHDGGKPVPLARLVYSGDPPLRPAPLPQPAPFPANGLPAQLPLGGALRTELLLGALVNAQLDWFAPDKFNPAAGPAFQVKRGRTVVLALTNHATQPMVFHLHGHHFRLLDRLDDGWKPFWLDTLAIDAGQTQRIAFAAEYPGLWLIEAYAAKWSEPRLLRSYLVS
ncbi:FtsP/CotA-like multicopper oxidase with cupredoxin domain [Rhodopseudomonas thermotolerans]|uniref:FtsP/CotA-like multicopper oxidase with cupredoxin domain n=3 Tax=Nitrobacteraceae TaxID=41294 RepID=A0A336JLJ6_9BRAD|nr:FtsP/CotA-like multicopper oxidase with cupredoxin domain [Rhodopseudomonas pentothenatexigens]REG08088.1 FtsP/CotA-like multicopper oxidase with cupredoxin domain [Rhodopseudomonas thermotolerans]SSW88899.1 FtsP/CotA-like multicopper oxidase with cupredoxin domain [Rhodopseudomonas pentothenatexigens]